MKKIMLLLLFSFCLLMFKINSVNALNDIEIKEVSIVEESDRANIYVSSYVGYH